MPHKVERKSKENPATISAPPQSQLSNPYSYWCTPWTRSHWAISGRSPHSCRSTSRSHSWSRRARRDPAAQAAFRRHTREPDRASRPAAWSPSRASFSASCATSRWRPESACCTQGALPGSCLWLAPVWVACPCSRWSKSPRSRRIASRSRVGRRSLLAADLVGFVVLSLKMRAD